ncbi:MAG: tRNA (guanosine(46)-N7)-methyltransferase TrmB [Proteobacteria bacterium]|nr:tRNA (guanosine(46)-N7)-methyltransferase TrmB [Pseudomonadota bacterium]
MPPLRLSHEIFPHLPDVKANHKAGLTNPYHTKILEEDPNNQFLILGSELREVAGHLRTWFQKKGEQNEGSQPQHHRLVVEVGCHYGHVLTQMAADHPNCYFLGLDITLKRVYQSAKKIKQQALHNAGVAYFNAHHLPHLFACHEIDCLVIFFPDPWHKKTKQQKHRLIQERFIRNLAPLLAPQGEIWFKTDCEHYFHSVDQLLLVHGFQTKQQSWLAEIHHHKKKQPYVSLFEQRFQELGQPIYEKIYSPPKSHQSIK